MVFRLFTLRPSCTFSVAAMSTLLVFSAIGQEPKPTISVKGEAEMSLVADEIVIDASIESRAKTAVDACKDNRQKSQLLLEFLKSKSIDEKLIRSDLLSIGTIDPEPDLPKGKGYSKPQSKEDLFSEPSSEENPFLQRRRPIGYMAFRNFAIVVKDLSKFEEIYQGIVEKGINRVDSVVYRSSQEKDHQEKLRQTAVRVAKERAGVMAQELGATLSGIKSISNSSNRLGNSGSRGMSGPRGGEMGYGGDPFGSYEVGTADGQITLQSSVDIVFYLGNADIKQ